MILNKHTPKLVIAFAIILFVSTSCNNAADSPSEVETGVTDSTNLFSPDNTRIVDTGAASNIRDTGLRP